MTIKNIILIICLLLSNIIAQSQSKPLIYRAVKIQTILDSTGVSKGWEKINVFVKFYQTENKLDSIIINKGKHFGVIINELKASYKIDDTSWNIYTGYDDEIAEDLEIRLALFEKEMNNEIGLLSIKYTNFAINIKLSGK